MREATTCWDLIRSAANGDEEESATFAALYRPLIVDFLTRRWRAPSSRQEIEDAAQETLLECLKERGALSRAVDTPKQRLRPFLFGVTMNVARRFEASHGRVNGLQGDSLPNSALAPAVETTPAVEFDRAWATNVMRQARDAFEAESLGNGESAQRRAEILRLRFFDDLPVRKIAEQIGHDVDKVHREYALARQDFKKALIGVIRYESEGGDVDLEGEIQHLMANLA